MGRHPASSASPERLMAFHQELMRTPHKWRACPLVSIQPIENQSKCREVRRCPVCGAELARPLKSLVLRYADQDGAAILPLGSALLTVKVDTSLAEIQREVIWHVYQLVGSVQATAQLMGVSRRVLYNWCPNLTWHEAEPKDLGFSIAPPSRKPRR